VKRLRFARHYYGERQCGCVEPILMQSGSADLHLQMQDLTDVQFIGRRKGQCHVI
jgi:hypothetical protein